jgi:glycyl-tRNA synthetase (class II)
MAEIEHYVDPLDKAHPRFHEVKDIKLSLLPKEVQLSGKTDLTEMTIGDAVANVSFCMWWISKLMCRVPSTTRLSVTSLLEHTSS